MNTLSETYNLLIKTYPQDFILRDGLDIQTFDNGLVKEPKYLFRGEKQIYKSAVSTLNRLSFDGYQFCEIILLNRSLYEFLRESLYQISYFSDDDHGKPYIEAYIIGIMQHYGFNTSYIDVTSDLEIAANFASEGDVGNIGRILVIDTNELNQGCIHDFFNLTKCPGHRPAVQSSYVLWDSDRTLDLCDDEYLRDKRASWFNFTISKECQTRFQDNSILSLKQDRVATEIVEWWDHCSYKPKKLSAAVSKYICSIIEKLRVRM